MDNKYGFDPSQMLFYNDEGLFTVSYDVKKPLSDIQIKAIIRLIGNAFEGSTFIRDFYIRANNSMLVEEFLSYYYNRRAGNTNDIFFNIPVYIQSIKGDLFVENTKYGGIEFICDEFEGGSNYGVTIYPHTYFDFSTINKSGIKIDQRKAASKNREILRDFLQRLEGIIEAKAKSVFGYHTLLEKHIYEYGVREGAEYLM